MDTHADRMIAAALERGDTAGAARWQRIKARVDAAPPLDAAQRDRLSVLLRLAAPIAARNARTHAKAA